MRTFGSTYVESWLEQAHVQTSIVKCIIAKFGNASLSATFCGPHAWMWFRTELNSWVRRAAGVAGLPLEYSTSEIKALLMWRRCVRKHHPDPENRARFVDGLTVQQVKRFCVTLDRQWLGLRLVRVFTAQMKIRSRR